MTSLGIVLLVEDDASIRVAAQTYLEQVGFEVVSTASGEEAVKLLREYRPDLVVLDLNLPDGDGMEITARIRQESDVYIFMVTARNDEVDRVAGLRLGADDYLAKPFSLRELAARIEAILRRRRTAAQRDAQLRFAHVQIDPERREAQVHEHLLDLTPTEFDVLLTLARHAGKVLSREQLIEQVWDSNFYGNDRVVDVYVGQVRRKLHLLTGEQLIRTVRGSGYKFVDPPATMQGGRARAVGS